MPRAEWHKVEELFQAALDVPTGGRRAWLHERCGDDAELCGEVESLLAAEAASEGFLLRAGFAKAAGALLADADRGARAVERIGHYRIVREVGRGGMGVVFLAEREGGQFSQRVAVKLVKRGLDTEDILRRFRNERQILASLHHPNIAQLFDGGETEDGRPYFVMEYVEGLPLLQYCEERGLSVAERLKMFRRVCAAVSHAHQNLVVHRDLKPSNILVTEDGEPKLLDFGVAKILNAGVAGETQTRAQQRVMTPEYASPEQVRGRHVTTATDVYSLGVVLFELLTGARPYKLKDASPEELSRAICDSEPTRPSDAAREALTAGDGESAADVRRQGRKTATHNPKLLRGDLDNIVLTALRKEPSRRYGSVEQLSEDIRRHLEGRPVVARKDTPLYRASKFVRRNRVGVAAACLVFLTLSGGIAATTWQARRAREQARIAEARSAEAKAALAKTEKINRFMQSIFSYANPQWFGRAHGRRDVSVLEAMRDIEKHIDEDFRDEPDVRADVYQQIGDSYRTQDLLEDAERNLRKALQLRLELYGEDSAKVAESMYILSGVRFFRHDSEEYGRLLTAAVEIQRRHPEEGNDFPYMLADYGPYLQRYKNDFAGALAAEREALELFRRRYGDGHYMVAEMQLVLFRTYSQMGDYPQAEACAAEYMRRKPSSSFYILPGLVVIAVQRGDSDAAEAANRRMLAWAHSHELSAPDVALMNDTQAALSYARGDYAQAEAHVEKALAAYTPSDARPYRECTLALAMNKLGKAARAEALLREEIERLKQSEQVFTLAVFQSALGEVLTSRGRFSEAEEVLRAAYEAQEPRVPPQQYDLNETRRRIVELHRAWGR